MALLFRKQGKLLVALGFLCLLILIMNKYGLILQGSSTTHDRYDNRPNFKQKLMLQMAIERGLGAGGTGSGSRKSEVKKILMHSFPYFYELKSGPEAFWACDHPCTLVLDHNMVKDVDSVVIYTHSFSGPDSLPQSRSPGQVWVFFAVESPANVRPALFRTAQWKGAFNWTMTYRRDSDFYFGYGDIRRLQPSLTLPVMDKSAVVAGKTRMAAWFVSNCHTQSKREDFVEKLKGFIQVDVYGHCGPNSCSRETRASDCMQMLTNEYYFYLALENSMCDDYLTEKVYHIMKLADVVPVVRGGANYSHLLPAHSFIDASSFPTVQALAEHLSSLASNTQLYLSYFAWKSEYQVIEPMPFSFCQFCERLHDKDRWARVYSDIDAWWAQGRCFNPPPVIKSWS